MSYDWDEKATRPKDGHSERRVSGSDRPRLNGVRSRHSKAQIPPFFFFFLFSFQSSLFIQDGTVGTHLEGVFEFSPHQHGDVLVRSCMKLNLQTDFASLFRISMIRRICISIGHIVKGKQRTKTSESPVLGMDHVRTMMQHRTTGFQETMISQEIFPRVRSIQFQL